MYPHTGKMIFVALVAAVTVAVGAAALVSVLGLLLWFAGCLLRFASRSNMLT